MTPLEHAIALLKTNLPATAAVHLEETDGRLIARYILHVTYESKASRRKVTVTAKGDTLPLTDDTLRYYLAQIVHRPQDIGKMFSMIYWLEKRSRQETFLYTSGKDSNGKATNNIRVSLGEDDRMTFTERNS